MLPSCDPCNVMNISDVFNICALASYLLIFHLFGIHPKVVILYGYISQVKGIEARKESDINLGAKQII